MIKNPCQHCQLKHSPAILCTAKGYCRATKLWLRPAAEQRQPAASWLTGCHRPSVPLHISPLRLGEAFVSHAWDGAFVAFAQAVFQASLASLFRIGKKLKPLVCFRSQLCSRLFSAVRFKLHARCFKPGNRRQISGFHSWSGAQRAQHLSVLRPKHFRAFF